MADDGNLEIAREFGFATVEQSNDQLGRKFNDGLEWAVNEGEADHVVLIGSDDWVHLDLFDRLPATFNKQRLPTPEEPVVISRHVPEALTGTKIALVNLDRGVLRRCQTKGRLGVIPWVFPRSALINRRPLHDDQGRGIDGALVRGLGCRPEWVFSDPHDLCRVDFKSDVNLNTYEAITGAIGYGEELPVSALARYYPQHLVDQIGSPA